MTATLIDFYINVAAIAVSLECNRWLLLYVVVHNFARLICGESC